MRGLIALALVAGCAVLLMSDGPQPVLAAGSAVERAVELAAKGASYLTPAEIRSRGGNGANTTGRPDQDALRLLKVAEKAFVLDSKASTLDLLPEPERSRYLSFQWGADDYPGGPVGPHEDQALALDAALARIRPERRANSTAAAVVTESQFNDDVWKYIESEERAVPGQEARKLNRWALASFIAMREAAKRDGVDIVVLSSNRLPSTAAANAARTNNAFAVARFSSHILGLAMDIRMSNDQQKYDEASTRPMSNIIAMRSSRAHKWMFLHGAAYGWYPYTHEPWHWEYNPPGFRERFWKGYGGGARS